MLEMATSRVSPVRPPVRLAPSESQAHPNPRTPSPRRAIPNYQSTDPLLRNLSPESTLKALSSTDAVPKNERAAHDILSKSISQVSQAERALGIRAAIAAQNLSLWYKEVQTWDWPNRTDVQLGKGFVPPASPPSDTEYYGSLPAAVVVQHEKRIEEIRDGMEELDVDELKEHVLNAHIPSRSRPSSSNSAVSVPPPLSYNQLSDFTAVITATILRALPLLSRLNSLLSTWDVRLLVLRQVSGLLRSLSLARSELDAALALLKSPEVPSESDALYSRINYHAKRAQLESTVLSAGRRMDRMLDALEGREDSLPEDWIDDLEAIESGFGTWVMEAEQRTVANEWQRMVKAKEEEAQATPSPVNSDTEPVNQPEPICTTGRLPMETIQEEPGSPRSVSSKTNEDDQFPSMSQVVAVLPATSESHDTSSVHEDSVDTEPVQQIQEPQVPISLSKPEEPTDESFEDDLATPTVQEQFQVPVDAELPEEHPRVPEATQPPSSKEGEVMPASKDVRGEESTSQDIPDSKESSGPIVEAEKSLPHRDSSESSPLSGPHQPPDDPVMPEKTENTASPNPIPKTELPSPNQVSEVIKADTLRNSNSSGTSSDHSDRPSSMKQELASPCPPSQRSSGTPDSVVVNRAPMALSRSASPLRTSPEPSALPDDDQNFATHEPERSPKQPLESPIKLSKTRPGRLDLDKERAQPGRRASNASAGSFSETDYPSLISSPEIREPRTGSSNGTPRLLETPPQFQHYRAPAPAPSNNEHTLREDRLFRLASAKASPRLTVNHNRNLSLPLQRFINERLELDFENDSPVEVDNAVSTPRTASPPVNATPRNERQATPGRSVKGRASTPSRNAARVSGQQPNSREGSSTPEPTTPLGKLPKTREQNKKTSVKSSNQKVSGEPAPHQTTTRLRKQLTTHPSLESIGAYKSRPLVEKASASSKPASRSSTPTSQLRKPKDHLDEKISSILTNLPTRIHLMSAEERESDDADMMSSLPMKARERFRSVSPQGTASRSGTPTPSLTLTPAPSRRRYSHAHAPEESSVKLYHLHRGGKSAPTKLFVRSVGEHGERVMVRVGGGWADLAEYLREYAIHHGRRHVSETPRVEVQGLSSRESTPSYSPPGSRLTPAANGRTTPSRPRSVMSNRPSSSLAVRKTRRSSNVSDMTDFRAASAGEALNAPISPKSMVSSRRRLSASSNASFGATSCVSEIRHGSSPSTTVGGSSHSIPLGLAGPKPRSRHVSMTPESEAWVEDVLGQARRSSSLRPSNYGAPPQEQEQPVPKPLSLPKSRSISDLGKAGSSKRVALRGLGNR